LTSNGHRLNAILAGHLKLVDLAKLKRAST